MMKQYDNKGNSFYIEIVPNITDEGKWTGVFQLVINARKSNIDDESFYQLEQLCQMGCAALSLMEEDKDFQNKVFDFMETPDTPANSNALPKKAIVKDVSGNVITLKFDKGTKK